MKKLLKIILSIVTVSVIMMSANGYAVIADENAADDAMLSCDIDDCCVGEGIDQEEQMISMSMLFCCEMPNVVSQIIRNHNIHPFIFCVFISRCC